MMRNARAVAALLAIFVLAGCASIPTSGAVKAGIQLDDSNAIELDILARGPQDGDSPEQILDGFLAAAASPQLDFRIAREFLTAESSKQWKPDAGTTVDLAAERSLSPTSESAIALRIKPVASVSADGNYAPAPASAAETRNYSFVLVNGQWRISSVPQGIVIDQPTFGIVFGAYALQFFSPDGQFFVPDVRWFARRETTQTAIVRALVAGPSPWLEPGVVNAIPAGSRLDADSVPVAGSTATVNLAMDTLPSGEGLSRMQAQLQSSLSGVSGITSVAISVNGTAENVAPLMPAPNVAPTVDSRPAVLTSSVFGFVSSVSGQIEPIPALSAALVDLAPNAIALGAGSGFAAARTDDGIFRVGAAGAQSVFSGSGWVAPTVDPSGGIWAARSSRSVSWQGADGGEAEFASRWGDAVVEGIAVSRDGARIAAVLQTGSSTRLVVSAISRGGDGSPTGVGDPLVVSEFSGTALSLAWVDPNTIAVLTTEPDENTIHFAVVGGQTSHSTAPAGAVSVSAGNGVRELRVRDSSGQVLQPSGASWQVRGTGISVLATVSSLR